MLAQIIGRALKDSWAIQHLPNGSITIPAEKSSHDASIVIMIYCQKLEPWGGQIGGTPIANGTSIILIGKHFGVIIVC